MQMSEFHMLFFTVIINLKTDPRSVDWPLMKSPLPILTILAAYIYFVKVWGPNWMKNKSPFQIEGIIIAYNILMVVLSAYFFFVVSVHSFKLI
jgi:hypothetical protein